VSFSKYLDSLVLKIIKFLIKRAENDFTKRRSNIREDQKNNDARSREIESIMAEE